MSKPQAIILHERLPDANGKPAGWLIILAGEHRERNIVVIMAYEIGLDYARQMAHLLAARYRVEVAEEFHSSAAAQFFNQGAGAEYNSYY